ncbi:MAG: hypothetical protein ACR2LV_01720 [Solirubrobacteraceae bacterium]
MLDPRIYRTGLVAGALAVIVLAFSLRDQQGALGTTLAPEAFNGQNAYASMTSLARLHPSRRPGSAGDNELAAAVAKSFRRDGNGFAVSTHRFSARTADGTRTLQSVSAVRVGLSPGSIVVVAHRDALSSPATAALSGTATLLELARVLSGTLKHTIVLVSTSASSGTAGADQLARRLAGSVDAVLVLGDLAGTRIRNPIVVPWSDGQQVAPPMLRNTVAAALGAQTGLRPGGTSFAGQLARLAFPLSVGEQGPFGARSEPAVLLSLSGDAGPAPDAAVSSPRIAALGRTVLQTISALDGGPTVPAPSAYLLYSGKVIPLWAIRLLVLALILPVLGATIDGLARARRRGHAIARWTIWVLAGAAPFVLGLALVLASRLVGLIGVAPPGPVAAGAVPLRGSGIAVLLGVGILVVVSLVWIRPWVIRLASTPGMRSGSVGAGAPGAAAAVLLVMCVAALAIWVSNPFAAALMLPALHLWMWVVAPDVRLRPAVRLALLAIGFAPPVLVAVYYAKVLGLDPLGVLWNGTLLLAGGQVSVLAGIEWSVVLGCAVSALVIAVGAARGDRAVPAPVTVRGPITYAGPGSLGGTKSALRR